MNDDEITSVNLEVHPTKDISDGHVNGSLTVVWRNWDKIIQNNPQMVYVSSINPGEIKGPHLHLKRNSYFACLHGRVLFIVKDDDGKYCEIESSDDNPVLIQVPKNYASAHINLSNSVSRILVLADIAWKPNDHEMKNVSFDDYDFSKWYKD